jgi:RNA polymerase sigma factor (sigma-70 family)
MTASSLPNMALYWNEALAEELLHFLTKRLKCADLAAEITHETYIRVCQAYQTTPVNNARALAYRIALNLAVDYQRKTKVRRSHSVEVDFEAFADSFQSSEAGPEQIAIGQQDLSTLENALMELPSDCRTAFFLHGIDGLTYQEIADHLGISTSMVCEHLARATAHCSKRMKQC